MNNGQLLVVIGFAWFTVALFENFLEELFLPVSNYSLEVQGVSAFITLLIIFYPTYFLIHEGLVKMENSEKEGALDLLKKVITDIKRRRGKS